MSDHLTYLGDLKLASPISKRDRQVGEATVLWLATTGSGRTFVTEMRQRAKALHGLQSQRHPQK
jgi:hypothetical protein